MGLDMYLEADKYCSTYNPDGDAEAKKVARTLSRAKSFPEKCPFPVTNVQMQVAYWRKANAIHAWFVRNVQNEEDDCRRYYVSRDQLRELLNLVRLALEAYKSSPEKAANFLPTQSGFFFGSTELDDWYKRDLENTERMLVRVLKLPECWSLYYQSSW